MLIKSARYLGLEPQEVRKALWLGAVLFAITSSYTLVKTARDSLFLSTLEASWLPWAYLAVGVVTLAISVVFGRLTHRLSPLQSLVATSVLSVGGLAAFALVLDRQARWVAVGFYFWVNAYGLIVVSQFWSYANSLSDPREAKRICGPVGASAILGGLVGGLIAAWLGSLVSLSALTAAGAALLAFSVPAVKFGARSEPIVEPAVAATDQAPAPLARVAYVRWLTLASLASVIVAGLLDYQMKIAVQQAYPTASQLASFFGRFYTILNVIAFPLQLFATRVLIERLGAVSAAGLLPIGIAAGAGATLVVPGFTTVLGTRLWDQILRFSVNKSAGELLFFPLAPGVKRRAKAFIEAGIDRFGEAVAGLLILTIGLVVPGRPSALPVLVIAIVAVWLVACWRLQGGYVRELGRNLGRMNLDPNEDRVSLRERGILKETVRMLASPYERVTLQAIDLLEQNAARLLDSRIPKLLAHPSPRVRARALERAAAHPSADTRRQVAEMIRDPDAMVRLMALGSCGGPGSRPSIGSLAEYLDSDDLGVRAAALSCLVEHADDKEVTQIRRLVQRWLTEGQSAERAAAVAALGRASRSEFEELLGTLLDDSDLDVRRAALRSAGRARLRQHVPALIHALAPRATEQAARDGLLAFGDRAAGTLGDWLSDPKVPLEIRRAIPRALGDLPTPFAVSSLFRGRQDDDIALSYRILKAANRLRSANPDLSFPVDLVEEDLAHDIGAFLFADLHAEIQHEGARSASAPGDVKRAQDFLTLVLRERRVQAFNRVFRRLALLYPPRPIFSAYLGLLSENTRVRGNALEYVERVLSASHRELVLPVLPDADRAARHSLATGRYQMKPLTRDGSLAALLEAPDPWLRACVLYLVGLRRQRHLLSRVEANMHSADARVREAAQWAKLAFAEG